MRILITRHRRDSPLPQNSSSYDKTRRCSIDAHLNRDCMNTPCKPVILSLGPYDKIDRVTEPKVLRKAPIPRSSVHGFHFRWLEMLSCKSTTHVSNKPSALTSSVPTPREGIHSPLPTPPLSLFVQGPGTIRMRIPSTRECNAARCAVASCLEAFHAK